MVRLGVFEGESMPTVYFVKAGDAVKIGYSNNIKRRMMKFQTGNHFSLQLLLEIPVPNFKEAHLLERNLHKWFRAYRIRNEWFKYSSLMESVIEEIKSGNFLTTITALEIASRFFIGDSYER